MLSQNRYLLVPLVFLCAKVILFGQASGPDWDQIERLRTERKFDDALQIVSEWKRRIEAGPDQVRLAGLERHLLNDLSRFPEALQASLKWIDLAERFGTARDQVEAQYYTGRSFTAQRRPIDARSHFQNAMREIATLQDSQLELAILIDLATVEVDLANYAEGKALLDRAEQLWNQTRNPRLGTRLWTARANIPFYQGDPFEALPLRERALEVARETKEPGFINSALGNLAQIHRQLHNYADALVYFRQALESEPRTPNRVITLIDIGICHFELNQFEDAEKIFEQARLAAIEIGSQRLEAFALGELGMTMWEGHGDARRALDYYDQAIALFHKTGDVRNAINYTMNKTTVLRDQGNCAEALELYREVERRTMRIPGQRVNPGVYKGMGQCLAALGRPAEAERLLRQSVDMAAARGDVERIWQGQRELARLYEKTSRYEEADQAYQAGLDAIETIRGSLRLDAFKADFFEDKVKVYEEYVNFLMSAPPGGGSLRALQATERSRARSLLDSLAESRAYLHETLPAEILDTEKQILAEISALQAQIRREGDSSARARQLQEKERQLDEFYLRVRSEHPRFREMRYAEPATLEAIQQTLAPDETILEYWIGESRSYGWIVGPQKIEVFPLPERSVLEPMVKQAYGKLLQPGIPFDGLQPLAPLLLGPLSSRQELPQSLIIVPSGILHYFPFEVLPVGTEGKLLADTSNTFYLPSASVLVYLRSAPVRPAAARLLAVGDPFYSGGPKEERAASLMGIQGLGPLPHTRREVLAVRSLFGRFHSSLLVGADATEGNLKREELRRYSVIHLAAHGWIDSHSPSRSALVFGDEPNPEEDGILQMREILRLPLNADLVTLSSCQSALGALITGEGMVSLTRSLFYAGTNSVVASLWNVNDAAAAQFMAGFYNSLRDGFSKAEALRRARLEMMQDRRYRHPHFWAAYVLIGEGSTPVAFPRDWPIYAALVLVLVLGAGLLARRLIRAHRL